MVLTKDVARSVYRVHSFLATEAFVYRVGMMDVEAIFKQ